MRWKLRAVMAALTAGLILPAELHAQTQTDSPAAVCDLAAFMLGEIESLPGQPKVFLGSPELTLDDMAPIEPRQLTLREGDPPSGRPYGLDVFWPKDPPSQALAAGYLAGLDQPLLTACPSFPDVLAARGIRIDPKAQGEWGPSGNYREALLRMAPPVISQDGLEALVGVDQMFAGRAGYGLIYHLRRAPGGPWRIADVLQVWVS